jgi:hypothetical protein
LSRLEPIDLQDMSRRQALRITLGERGLLRGSDTLLSCLVVELSAGGARLAFKGRLPRAPLVLTFGLRDEAVALPVVVQRQPAGGGAIVRFAPTAAERLTPLIEAELSRAEGEGRRNVVERRSVRRAPEAVRGEVL